MKIRAVVALLATAVAASCLGSGSPEVEAALGPFVKRGEIAGVVSVLSDADYNETWNCFGWADAENKVPMRPDTVFAVYSMSKTFAGCAVMIAVDRGILKLDDPVAKYLPEFKDVKNKITIRECMCHVTGIDGGSTPCEHCAITVREQAKKFAREGVCNRKPGEAFKYGNASISAAMACLEVASGVPYDEFLRKNILDPLGMKDTAFVPNQSMLKRMVKAYTTKGGPFKPAADSCVKQLVFPCDHKIEPMPAAGLYSTPADMLRFSQMLAHHGEWKGVRIVSRAAFDKVWTVKQTPPGVSQPYTLGSWIYGDWFGHEGAMRTDQRANIRTGHSRVFFIQTENSAGKAFFDAKRDWNAACDVFQKMEKPFSERLVRTVENDLKRVGVSSALPSEREYIWPDGKVPDFQVHQISAKTAERAMSGFKADDFRRPYLEWYAPDPATGRVDLCVLFISGGGFFSCCDAERMQPAIDRFVQAGITVASLTYRTPRPVGLPIYQSGWEDAQRAVRVIRSQAAKRGFSPDKIAATGISAGAKLVLLLATSSETRAYEPVDDIDKLPCNLLFAIPQAPAYVLSDGETTPNSRQGDAVDVKLLPEFRFDAKTCPMCLFQGGIDEYSPSGSTQIYRQLRRMKIPAEIHLFAGRWHGFHGDLNNGDEGTSWDHWFYRAMEFVRQMNYDGRLGAEVKLMDRFASDGDRASYEKQEIWPAGKMPSVQTNQCVPYIEWHLPKVRKTAAIQIIYSGGSYKGNSPDSFEVAPARRYLNAKGMTVVTMRYRTPRPLNLAKHTSAWQDLQRAIRVVRSQAKGRGLDPDRIGIMGSSAGGHLTLMGVTSSRHWSYYPIDELDKLSCKVQWGVAIYPAYSLTDGIDVGNTTGGNDDAARMVPEFSFDLDTCPMLFVHGDSDGWAAMNSVKCWEQLRRMGIQSDLHTLATREHCFQRNAAPGTGSYTFLDRIWEFMNGCGFNR